MLSATYGEKYLQREVGDPQLRVKWDNEIERFVVGRKLDSHIEWFYVVTDGDSGFRPIDTRTVRKVISLDTWRREKTLTPEQFAAKLQEQKLDREAERREAVRYRLKHEARYIKKAAEKDGLA